MAPSAYNFAEESIGSGLQALVIDDEETICVILAEILSDIGFTVVTAGSYDEGLQHWTASSFDLLVVDKNLPDGNGLTMAQTVLERSPDCEVILISAYPSVDAFVEAMRLDVADFLLKPFMDLGDLKARIQRTVERLRLARDHRQNLVTLEEKDRTIAHLKTELAKKQQRIDELTADHHAEAAVEA